MVRRRRRRERLRTWLSRRSTADFSTTSKRLASEFRPSVWPSSLAARRGGPRSRRSAWEVVAIRNVFAEPSECVVQGQILAVLPVSFRGWAVLLRDARCSTRGACVCVLLPWCWARQGWKGGQRCKPHGERQKVAVVGAAAAAKDRKPVFIV